MSRFIWQFGFIVSSMLAVGSSFLAESRAAAVQVSLDATAAETSRINAYFSDGIAQLGYRYIDPINGPTTRQPFYAASAPLNLSSPYNVNTDIFPNENAMKFGNLTYDNATLVGGTGTTAITGLTLGIERDPTNSSYVNGTWLSYSTVLGTYSGTVTLSNGVLTGINLTASYTGQGSFGAQVMPWSGTFTITGNQFQVLASSDSGTRGAYDPEVGWNWSGSINAVSAVPEPSTYALLALGLAGAATWFSRRQNRGGMLLTSMANS